MKNTILKYRWFVENCHEFVLPTGEHILVDPMLPREGSRMYKGFGSGYTVDDIERCDYVFITHIHGDHIDQLKEVQEKFNPYILINQNNIIPLARALDLNVRKMIPLVDYQTYDLGSFRFTPYPGTHVKTIGEQTLSQTYAMFEKMTGEVGATPGNEAQAFGSCFNTNFMLEISGGIRTAFIQGQYTDLTKYAFMHSRPNLLIRQLSRIDLYPEIYDELLDCVKDTQTGMMAFMCHHHKEKDPQKTSADMNRDLGEMNVPATVFVPEKGRWINVGSFIEFAE